MDSSAWDNQLVFTPQQDSPVIKRRKLDKPTSKNLNAIAPMASEKLILDDIASRKATSNIQLNTQCNRLQVLTNSGKILDLKNIQFSLPMFPSYPNTIHIGIQALKLHPMLSKQVQNILQKGSSSKPPSNLKTNPANHSRPPSNQHQTKTNAPMQVPPSCSKPLSTPQTNKNCTSARKFDPSDFTNPPVALQSKEKNIKPQVPSSIVELFENLKKSIIRYYLGLKVFLKYK